MGWDSPFTLAGQRDGTKRASDGELLGEVALFAADGDLGGLGLGPGGGDDDAGDLDQVVDFLRRQPTDGHRRAFVHAERALDGGHFFPTVGLEDVHCSGFHLWWVGGGVGEGEERCEVG